VSPVSDRGVVPTEGALACTLVTGLADAAIDQEIERCAAPAHVRAAVSRLIEDQSDLAERLRAEPAQLGALVAVLAASRSLTRFVETHPVDALAVLDDLDAPVPVTGDDPEALVHTKQCEFLRIAARDLTGADALETTGALLSQLAANVLGASCRLAGADAMAVVGMGKLGGSELNYASDIDVMFVGNGSRDAMDRQARGVMDLAARCFRIDANLRPEGRDGPLVRSVESYVAYWDKWAAPWEFQALLKARPVAGDPGLGDRWFSSAQERLWNRPLGSDDLRSLRALKGRAEQEVARKSLTERELKRGPGGIRDIEFTLQLLQLVHGHSDAELRSPNTLSTLQEMAEAGYVDPEDAARLADAYRFFRKVEHRLQLVDEQQVHTLPADREALDRLARVLGYRETPRGSTAEQLESDVRRQQAIVRSIHERVYFRPLLEAFAGTEGRLSPEAAVDRLAAFGFTDAKRTQAAVRELTRGLNRSSRLMQQMLPLLLDWLSSAPDPDLGLLVVRNLLGRPERSRLIIEAFRDSAEVAQRLCTIAGTSRLLGDILAHNPDLVSRLPYGERLRTKAREELVASAATTIGWRPPGEREEGLRRWKDRHLFGIAASDVLGYADVDVVGANLTNLADATLDAALATIDPQVPFGVIAMGRYGGAELSYASDLDVVFVYEGGGAAAAEEASRVATRLLRFVGGSTPSERLFVMDADLRPEGKQGPLARSAEGLLAYWRTYAETWERQAMTRARAAAGDVALTARVLDDLEAYVWGDGLSADEILAIRRMKARIEGERIPAGDDPQFHLKLGRGSLSDVEFTAQMLQLQHGVRATGTAAALRALAITGVLDDDDADTLADSYRFCERVRNRWYLVNSGPSDSLPMQPEPLSWLARSLGTTPGELREEYRRVTRRARRVVERVFYGQP
jgi:[glutamine synthetase] adenylyltransferase / [glutamine synthetase]-adenylyl-L-tyrosine phosphorylase